MFAELGRRADAALARGRGAAHDVARATSVYVRRIGGAVSVALRRMTSETKDLVWNYQDVAADLRRSGPAGTQEPSQQPSSEGGRPALRVVGSQD